MVPIGKQAEIHGDLQIDLEEHVNGCTLFYFTDNMVTYYIATSGSSSSTELQVLLRRLKYWELHLNIRLEVVHVPGTHVIANGSDGLSRGLRMDPSRMARSPLEETRLVFDPVPPSRELADWLGDKRKKAGKFLCYFSFGYIGSDVCHFRSHAAILSLFVLLFHWCRLSCHWSCTHKEVYSFVSRVKRGAKGQVQCLHS